MNLINCAENCAYQIDGCCRLKGGGQVTNAASGGCVYKTKVRRTAKGVETCTTLRGLSGNDVQTPNAFM